MEPHLEYISNEYFDIGLVIVPILPLGGKEVVSTTIGAIDISKRLSSVWMQESPKEILVPSNCQICTKNVDKNTYMSIGSNSSG